MANQMDPFIQKLLYGGQPSPYDFMQGPMQQKIGTPGINPNAPDPRLPRGDVAQQPAAQPQKPGVLGTIDKFLTSPGGGFLMNLLADSGYSPVPQSPMSSIGRATLATQAQQQARGMSDMQRRLIESQIGVNQREIDSPYGGTEPLTTIAKLRADLGAGRVSPEVFAAERDKILRGPTDSVFDKTTALRAEFRKDTDALRASQMALAKSKSLLQSPNPFSATAAFTSFIQSIDNSIVRPAEQAAYSQAAGMARRLEDELSKLKGSGPLSDASRRDLLESIETLEGVMNGIHSRTVDFYNKEAGYSQLRPESVTGLPSVESPNVTIESSEDTSAAPSAGDITQTESDIARLEAEIAELENANR